MRPWGASSSSPFPGSGRAT
uniref:Uncharacterized protein n=1 Tax=Arundo donax TaxID=35708 RepID=A0A0A8ZV72_ARUDO